MTGARMDLSQVAPEAFKRVLALEGYVTKRLDHLELELIKLRASIVNGCAFCVDLHTTSLLDAGQDPRRVVAVSTWRESTMFSGRERTLLELTDAVTRLDEHGVPDALWAAAEEEFGQELLADLLVAIATINVWNRIAVPTRLQTPPLA